MKSYIITQTEIKTGDVRYWARSCWTTKEYRGYYYWTKAAAKGVITRKNFQDNFVFTYSIEERE